MRNSHLWFILGISQVSKRLFLALFGDFWKVYRPFYGGFLVAKFVNFIFIDKSNFRSIKSNFCLVDSNFSSINSNIRSVNSNFCSVNWNFRSVKSNYCSVNSNFNSVNSPYISGLENHLFSFLVLKIVIFTNLFSGLHCIPKSCLVYKNS